MLKRLKLPKLNTETNRIVPRDDACDRTLLNPEDKCEDMPSASFEDAPKFPSAPRSYKEVWMRLKTKVIAHIYLKKLLKNIKIFAPNLEEFNSIEPNDENFLSYMHAKGIKLAEAVAQNEKQSDKVLSPNSIGLSLWNITMVLILLYTATISPFLISFTTQNIWDTFYDVDIAIDFFFMIDLIITFNSAYYNEDNQLITSRKKIAMHYFKGWLFLDLISSIPFGLIQAAIFDNSNNAAKLVRLTRIRNIPKILRLSRLVKMVNKFNYFEEFEFLVSLNQRVIRLVKTLTGITISLHLVACFWHMSAMYDDFSPSTWVVRYGYIDTDIWTRYLACLYWALTTLTTVGYGDISAYTVSEKLIAMSWMVMAIYFLSFSIGSLSSMLSQQYTKEKIINDKLILADEYKKINNISQSIIHRIKRSLRNSSDFSCFSSDDRAALLDKLPIKLRYEIALDMHNGIIKSFPFFSIREDSFVASVAPYLDYCAFNEYQYIWIKGEPASCIYFVVKGRVNYLFGNENVIFRTFRCGHYFGDFEIFKGKVRHFNVAAGSAVGLLSMNAKIIEKVEKNFPLVWSDMRVITNERQKKLLMNYAEIKVLNDLKLEGKDAQVKEMKTQVETEYREMVDKQIKETDEQDNIQSSLDLISKQIKSNTEMLQRIEEHLVFIIFRVVESIKIGITNTFPLSSCNSSQASGFLVELYEKILQDFSYNSSSIEFKCLLSEPDLMNSLSNQEIDIAALNLTSEVYNQFNITPPFMNNGLIVVSKNSSYSLYWVVFEPFEKLLWVILCLLPIVIGHVHWALERSKEGPIELSYRKGVVTSIWSVFLSFFFIAKDTTKKIPAKIIIVSYWFLALLLFSVYIATLSSRIGNITRVPTEETLSNSPDNKFGSFIDYRDTILSFGANVNYYDIPYSSYSIILSDISSHKLDAAVLPYALGLYLTSADCNFSIIGRIFVDFYLGFAFSQSLDANFQSQFLLNSQILSDNLGLKALLNKHLKVASSSQTCSKMSIPLSIDFSLGLTTLLLSCISISVPLFLFFRKKFMKTTIINKSESEPTTHIERQGVEFMNMMIKFECILGSSRNNFLKKIEELNEVVDENTKLESRYSEMIKKLIFRIDTL